MATIDQCVEYQWPSRFWPSQTYGCQTLLEEMAAGFRRLVLTSPTGCGKSAIMTALIEWASSNGFPSILYTNRRMLFTQTMKVLEEDGIEYGLRASGHKPALLRDVQLAMTASEYSAVIRTQRRELHHARLVLADELHMQGGAMLGELMERHYEDGATIIGITATPIDLDGEWDKLVVAGSVSDGRKCGALVPAVTYCPDQPDLKHVKKYRVGDDLTDKQNSSLIMRPGVFGRVFEHWKRLNPEGKPTILFGPDVAGSIYFAKEFTQKGVPSAHIDAKEIWIDGEFIDSTDENRQELLEKSQRGEIVVLCNRFVLREGINLPHLAHAIFATVFGSLRTYIQAGGRVLRAHPSLESVCIAKGSKVLTDKGPVNIEDITLSHRLWDGVEFVSHMGLVSKGNMRTINWDGLNATPDHKVHTDEGWTTLAEAKACNQRLTRAGDGGKAIRVFDNSDPHNPEYRTDIGSRSNVRQVRNAIVCENTPNRTQDSKGMRELRKALRATLPRMDLPSCPKTVEAMQRHEDNVLREVRWSWNRVSFRFSVGCDSMDCEEPRCSIKSKADSGSHRQQRSLRAREFAVVLEQHPDEKSGTIHYSELPLATIQETISRSDIPSTLCRCSIPQWTNCQTDCGQVEVEVFDILNAGPRHRFTASGVLVGNCVQDHGGNYIRHGSLNSDRQWELNMRGYCVTGQRQDAMREKPEMEPIICPKCGAGRLSGPACLRCGYTYHKRSRVVVQIDGTLKCQSGPSHKPKRVAMKPDTQRIWESCYHRAKSKKWNATFNQAEALFFRENFYYPPRTLPLMPKQLGDWYEKVGDVPKERLL